MKKLSYLALVLATSLTACEFDNFAPPESVLEGRLVYQGQPVSVRENAIQLELWQEGYALRDAIPVYVKQDGTFAAKLFDGKYKLVPKQNNGPWQSNADTIQVELRNSQTLDVPVSPYFIIENATIERSNATLTATFDVQQVIEGWQVERVALYVATTQFVDSKYSTAQVESTDVGAVLSGPTTLALELGDLATSEAYVFARVGVKTVGVEEMIYTPVQKIELK